MRAMKPKTQSVSSQTTPPTQGGLPAKPTQGEQDLSCYKHDKINCSECFGGFNPKSETLTAREHSREESGI
jgi:hypothetical protein